MRPGELKKSKGKRFVNKVTGITAIWCSIARRSAVLKAVQQYIFFVTLENTTLSR
jgi:hypothetical protein